MNSFFTYPRMNPYNIIKPQKPKTDISHYFFFILVDFIHRFNSMLQFRAVSEEKTLNVFHI